MGYVIIAGETLVWPFMLLLLSNPEPRSLFRTQGLDAVAARTMAKSMMSKMPAWKGHA